MYPSGSLWAVAAGLLVVSCSVGAESDSDKCGRFQSHVEVASDLRKAGKREASRLLYQRAFEEASEEGCRQQVARALNGLGYLKILAGLPVDGLRLLDLATNEASELLEFLAGKERSVVEELLADIDHNRGAAFVRLVMLEDAKDAFRRVQAIDGRIGTKPEDQAKTLIELARLHRRLGETPAAEDVLKQAFKLRGEHEPTMLASLWEERARLAMATKSYDKAEQALDQALRSLATAEDPIARAVILSDRAELEVERGRWEEALDWAHRAQSMASGIGSGNLNLDVHTRYLQSVALANRGDLAGAKRKADLALALLDDLRYTLGGLDLGFVALRQKYYRHRLGLATEPAEAWEGFEGYRSRGLLGDVAQRSLAAVEESKELEKARKRLNEAITRLERSKRAHSSHQSRLLGGIFRDRLRTVRQLETHRLLAAGLDTPRGLTLAEAAEALDSQTLALTFAVSSDHKVGRDRLRLFALDALGQLEEIALEMELQQVEAAVDTVLRGLDPFAGDEARARGQSAGSDLSLGLIMPLADLLDHFERLVVVADGPLEVLPFEVLRHPRTQKRLIKSHEIVYVPSFSVLRQTRNRSASCSKPRGTVLALGDPVLSDLDLRWPLGAESTRDGDEAMGLRRVEETAEESVGIARLDHASRSLVGLEATREQLIAEASDYRMIHVATHARSEPKVPPLSKVMLSCAGPDGRIAEPCDLYLEDVLNLDLCGQTVILSGCATAEGEFLAGEGIVGLPRAFFQAGASTVIASRWRVEDASTAKLMIAFHRAARDGMTLSAALRQAKLERIAAGQPASHWAPFVLLGDWLPTWPSTFSSSPGLIP